ncbi:MULTISPECIES: hypothetical protein [unclassified Bacillus (in: firmicutes)]|uniref:hypothetical protein n=1 Tax=unclassified Bacillus (in: firmicutes) TaxID=185979 RepID=UPI0030F8369F
MVEGSVMTLFKVYIFCFCLVLVADVANYCIRLNQINDFKQYANYQIERRGGLTKDAFQAITKKNENSYGGSFQIESSSLNQKHPYGTEITYSVKTTYQFLIGGHKQEITARGGALSLVR